MGQGGDQQEGGVNAILHTFVIYFTLCQIIQLLHSITGALKNPSYKIVVLLLEEIVKEERFITGNLENFLKSN